MKSEHRELLRRLTLSDEAALTSVMAGLAHGSQTLLENKVRSLVRLAGLIALDAKTSSLQASTERAFAAGATAEEILEVVLIVAPIVGSSRISSVLPRMRTVLQRD